MTRPERRKEEKKEAEEAQKRLKRVHFLRATLRHTEGCKFSSCTRHMWGTRSPHWQGHWLEQQQGVRGDFIYELGVVSYTINDTYLDVSCMYPACILKDTRIPNVS